MGNMSYPAIDTTGCPHEQQEANPVPARQRETSSSQRPPRQGEPNANNSKLLETYN